jgi:ubiquitin-like protein Pup
MPQQQHSSGSSRDNRDDDSAVPAPAAPHVSVSGVDDLLDEIDSLLEDNAEAFVKSFVQKGGQ